MARDANVFAPLLAALLGLALVVTVALDPATPLYRSAYDPRATDAEIARWLRDFEQWPKAPTWNRFQPDAPPDALGPPDWTGTYLFGKYRYRVEVQVRGDRMHYVSWGVDDQTNGGAWTAVGEGKRLKNGEWFSVWSCLDISRAVSNGGGAWFQFSADRKRIQVRYYHDTLPFGEAPVELGEAVALEADDTTRKLEGRVPTRVKTAEGPFTLWGRVVDPEGNGIAGAAVKRRGAGGIEATSDARGFFRLELPRLESLTLVAAGKAGYVNGIVTLEQQSAFLACGSGSAAMATIELRPFALVDHRDYEFTAPDPTAGAGYRAETHLQCGNCHTREYDSWRTSRHASSATNPWTLAAFRLDARPHALANGDQRDRCTPCHSPSLAATLDTFSLNSHTMLNAGGVHAGGNHCDFCHKIWSVPNPEAPGMDGSLRLLRPDPHDDTFPGGVKRVFGALPDVSFLYMGAAYNPLFQMGLLCAGCHEHRLENGVHGQSTYSEWQQTRFAKPGADYRECQSCHMPPYRVGRVVQSAGSPEKRAVDSDLKVEEIEKGGMEIARYSTRYRPFSEAHKHSFVGTDDAEFVRAGVSMQVERLPGPGVHLRVTVTNAGAGHAIPTGHGLKRYLLAVTAYRGNTALAPDATRPADERMGAIADATAGAVFGRQFAGSTGDWALPYWRASAQSADTRLWPDQPRVLEFHFAEADRAQVKLVLRRGSPTLLKAHDVDPTRPRPGRGRLDTIVHEWK
ncbi:MAG: hypothetical protein IT463_05625 [Planctomycetes bacterium]|nr:hypothetical protein [Planctomycetota bacterium]